MRCCEQPENREIVENVNGKIVEVCVVCGCRHVKLKFEPFTLSKPAAEKTEE